MNAQTKHSALLALFALALVLPGCAGKKKPEHTVSAPPVVVEHPVSSAPSRPLSSADAVESPLDGDLRAATEHAHSAGLLGDVYFDFDEAELRADARDRLARNAEFLRSRSEFVVSIEGHCDERGTSEYNLALGERRAQAARQYLVSLGIQPSRIQTLTLGEERPVCTDSNEGCWQRNRRGHFVLTGRVGKG